MDRVWKTKHAQNILNIIKCIFFFLPHNVYTYFIYYSKYFFFIPRTTVFILYPTQKTKASSCGTFVTFQVQKQLKKHDRLFQTSPGITDGQLPQGVVRFLYCFQDSIFVKFWISREGGEEVNLKNGKLQGGHDKIDWKSNGCQLQKN